MNDENLIPFDKRSESEQRKIRSMGGKARAEKARQKNSLKEILTTFCESSASNDVSDAFSKLGFEVSTKLQAMVAKYITLCMSKRATAKDINSFLEFMGKYTGQEPAQKLEIEDKPVINIDIPK